MKYDELVKKFNETKLIKFRLFCLDYTISQNNDLIEIKSPYTEKRTNKFKTLDELLNNYTVYNESLRSQINKIKFLE